MRKATLRWHWTFNRKLLINEVSLDASDKHATMPHTPAIVPRIILAGNRFATRAFRHSYNGSFSRPFISVTTKERRVRAVSNMKSIVSAIMCLSRDSRDIVN